MPPPQARRGGGGGREGRGCLHRPRQVEPPQARRGGGGVHKGRVFSERSGGSGVGEWWGRSVPCTLRLPLHRRWRGLGQESYGGALQRPRPSSYAPKTYPCQWGRWKGRDASIAPVE